MKLIATTPKAERSLNPVRSQGELADRRNVSRQMINALETRRYIRACHSPCQVLEV